MDKAASRALDLVELLSRLDDPRALDGRRHRLETQQFESRMRLLIQKAAPEPHLAPSFARSAHPSADLAHEERLASQQLSLFPGQAHFHERAAVGQSFDELGVGSLTYPQQKGLFTPGRRSQ
jgi:hypothetical protein